MTQSRCLTQDILGRVQDLCRILRSMCKLKMANTAASNSVQREQISLQMRPCFAEEMTLSPNEFRFNNTTEIANLEGNLDFTNGNEVR